MLPDAVIIGAGPAGATAARLLANWGHSVVLYRRPGAKPANIAESLPPSIRTALQLHSLIETVDAAGFPRSAGNLVWWGTPEAQVEQYPAPRWGYHVRRADFDALLLRLAVESGVELREEAVDPHALPQGRFLLDCSGRAGVVARHYRIYEPRTLSLGAIWRSEAAFAYPAHTWVEAHAEGWAWSVPLSEHERWVAFETDTSGAELEKTPGLRSLLAHAVRDQKFTACDAGAYHSSQYVAGRTILVGDASSFLDPLSSFGVKKALTSSWLAAVAVHTALVDKDREEMALNYYQTRERQAFLDASRHTARHAAALAGPQRDFWNRRSTAAPGAEFYNPAALESELAALRETESMQLSRDSTVEWKPAAAVDSNEIVIKDTLVIPQLPAGLAFVNGVELAKLIPIAERHGQLPQMYEAYCAENEQVDLPNFLGAVCLLLHTKVLTRVE